jgi:hypothetical protein
MVLGCGRSRPRPRRNLSCWWSWGSWNSAIRPCWRCSKARPASPMSLGAMASVARPCTSGWVTTRGTLRQEIQARYLPTSDGAAHRGPSARDAMAQSPVGPRTILNSLARAGIEPLPSRSAIYRCLVRHVLIDPKPRRRKPSDYKRRERSRAMELWQMDVTLGAVWSRHRPLSRLPELARLHADCATIVASPLPRRSRHRAP